MSKIDELGKIILDETVSTSERVRAVQQLQDLPERATFELLLRSMLQKNRSVRERAAEVFSQLVLFLIESAAGEGRARRDDTYQLLVDAAYYLLAIVTTLSRRDEDPAASSRAFIAVQSLHAKLTEVLESVAVPAEPVPAEAEPRVVIKPQAPPQRPKAGSQGPPAAAALSAPAVIFLAGPLVVPVAELGSVVANESGLPELEIRNNIYQTKGIVLRDVEPPVARRVLAALDRIGQNVFAVERDDCWPPPDLTRALSFEVTPGGFYAEVQSAEKREKVEAKWDSAYLVCGVRIFRETTKTVAVKQKRLFRYVMVERVVPTVEDNYIIDLILADPPRRIRIGEPLPDLSAMGIKITGGGEIDSRKAAAAMLAARPDLRVSEGVRLLASPQADLGPVTFSAKVHIEHYELWLIQLARFGLFS